MLNRFNTFFSDRTRLETIVFLLLLLLLYFPLFGHLDAFTIRMWDEGRLANNALEMYYNGNYLTTTFDGAPDLWNTKPPLMIWCQVAFMHLLGPSELAIRLPSALAGLGTCLLVFFFLKRNVNLGIAFLGAMILATTNGYVHHHVTRTGDYDALLVFFLTVSGMSLFYFCKKQSPKSLYLFFFSLMLAVLTKGIAGLLFAPAYLVFLIWKKHLIPLFKNKHFYTGILIFLLPILAFYLGREHQNTGYLEAVFANELGGRFLEVNEGNSGAGMGYWFYFHYLYEHLGLWLAFLVGALFSIWKWKGSIQNIGIFSLIMSLCYFAVITISKTKLYWYDAPLFPFLAVSSACFIAFLFQKIESKKIKQLLVFLVCSCVAYTYFNIIQKTNPPRETEFDKGFYAATYLLRKAVNKQYDLDGVQLVRDGRNGFNLFYIKQLQHRGVKVAMGDYKVLKTGDTILVAQQHIKDYLDTHYEYETLEGFGTLLKLRIINSRPAPL